MCRMCLPIDSSTCHDRLCRIRLYTKPFFRCQKNERSLRSGNESNVDIALSHQGRPTTKSQK